VEHINRTMDGNGDYLRDPFFPIFQKVAAALQQREYREQTLD
jgi:hypothetical protein